MGLLNDLWWLSGFVLAAPLTVVGLEYLGRNNVVMGAAFLVIALAALLLPEYVRWQLFGGDSILEKVPRVGGDTEA